MECDKKHFAETRQHKHIQTPDSIPLCSDPKWKSAYILSLKLNVIIFKPSKCRMFFLELLLIQILAYTSQQVLLHSIKNAGLLRPHRWVKKMHKQVKFTQKMFLFDPNLYWNNPAIKIITQQVEFVAYWPNHGLKKQHFLECMYLWDCKGVRTLQLSLTSF